MIGVRSPRLARFRVVRGEMMPGVASFELENGEKRQRLSCGLGCYPDGKGPRFLRPNDPLRRRHRPRDIITFLIPLSRVFFSDPKQGLTLLPVSIHGRYVSSSAHLRMYFGTLEVRANFVVGGVVWAMSGDVVGNPLHPRANCRQLLGSQDSIAIRWYICYIMHNSVKYARRTFVGNLTYIRRRRRAFANSSGKLFFVSLWDTPNPPVVYGVACLCFKSQQRGCWARMEKKRPKTYQQTRSTCFFSYPCLRS